MSTFEVYPNRFIVLTEVKILYFHSPKLIIYAMNVLACIHKQEMLMNVSNTWYFSPKKMRLVLRNITLLSLLGWINEMK